MTDDHKIEEIAKTLYSKGFAASMWDARNKAKDILGISRKVINNLNQKPNPTSHKAISPDTDNAVSFIMKSAGIDPHSVKKAEAEKEVKRREFMESAKEPAKEVVIKDMKSEQFGTGAYFKDSHPKKQEVSIEEPKKVSSVAMFSVEGINPNMTASEAALQEAMSHERKVMPQVESDLKVEVQTSAGSLEKVEKVENELKIESPAAQPNNSMNIVDINADIEKKSEQSYSENVDIKKDTSSEGAFDEVVEDKEATEPEAPLTSVVEDSITKDEALEVQGTSVDSTEFDVEKKIVEVVAGEPEKESKSLIENIKEASRQSEPSKAKFSDEVDEPIMYSESKEGNLADVFDDENKGGAEIISEDNADNVFTEVDSDMIEEEEEEDFEGNSSKLN